ncbi:rRNA maturation RNase YbeY [Patescibacteria group bacterium]|nr:rRNA maturation RNase YbeY [Patescibacteria group bacterium]
MQKLDLVIHGRVPIEFSEGELSHIFKTTMQVIKKQNGIFGLAFLNQLAMAKLNKQYHGGKGATDVLSIAYQDKKDKNLLEGDIMISPVFVKINAKSQNIPYKEELTRVLIHGILHIAGFTHYKDSDQKKMFSLQEKILSKI